jgi:putative heme iron utilization protein
VTIPTADAQELIAAEEGILQHMNSDHADAISLLAARCLASSDDSPAQDPQGMSPSWRMIGCDPEGIDLASGPHALRVRFPSRVTTPDAVRQALVQMVRDARAST